MIIQGHATDLMKQVGTVDLVATDPPYSFSGTGEEHAISAAVPIVLREAAKRLLPGKWMVVFSASSWRSTLFTVESVRGILEPVRIATWCKPVARSKAKTPGWAWASVNVIAFRKGKSSSFSPSGLLDHICRPPETVGRRAMLPTEVADWAIAPFVVPDGKMLDPFAGSGRLCEAATRAGMSALGFEWKP